MIFSSLPTPHALPILINFLSSSAAFPRSDHHPRCGIVPMLLPLPRASTPSPSVPLPSISQQNVVGAIWKICCLPHANDPWRAYGMGGQVRSGGKTREIVRISRQRVSVIISSPPRHVHDSHDLSRTLVCSKVSMVRCSLVTSRDFRVSLGWRRRRFCSLPLV